MISRRNRLEELILEVKHLAGRHDQKTHGRPMEQFGSHVDERIGRRPDPRDDSPLSLQRHVQRIITSVRADEYISRKKVLSRRIVPTVAYIWSDTGENVTDKDTLKHVMSVKVSGEVNNVRINPDPDADLQATWTDAKGKLKYGYSSTHVNDSNWNKWMRMRDFEAVLPSLRKQIKQDIDSKDPKVRECARALYIIDKTGLRQGSTEKQLGDVQSYGIFTLLNSQVSTVANPNRTVSSIFDFPGRHGIRTHMSIADNTMARIVDEQKGSDPKGKLFTNISPDDPPKYLKIATGRQYSPQDLRAYHATNKALQEISRNPKPPETHIEFNRRVQHVAYLVARHMGVSERSALQFYIAPFVWQKWRKPEWGPYATPGTRKVT